MLHNVRYNLVVCGTRIRHNSKCPYVTGFRPAARNMATSATIQLPNGTSVRIPTGLFIDNEFVPAIKCGTFEYAIVHFNYFFLLMLFQQDSQPVDRAGHLQSGRRFKE